MTQLQRLREQVRDRAQNTRKDVAASGSDETFYADGKLIGYLDVLDLVDNIEKQDALEAEAKDSATRPVGLSAA